MLYWHSGRSLLNEAKVAVFSTYIPPPSPPQHRTGKQNLEAFPQIDQPPECDFDPSVNYAIRNKG